MGYVHSKQRLCPDLGHVKARTVQRDPSADHSCTSATKPATLAENPDQGQTKRMFMSHQYIIMAYAKPEPSARPQTKPPGEDSSTNTQNHSTHSGDSTKPRPPPSSLCDRCKGKRRGECEAKESFQQSIIDGSAQRTTIKIS